MVDELLVLFVWVAEEIVDEDDEGGKRVELACHTDKKIKFRKIS